MLFVFVLLLVSVVVWGVVGILRLIARAMVRGEAWAAILPRVAFPLLLGVIGTRYLMGNTRLEQEMGHWHLVLSAVCVVLGSLAATVVTITVCIRKGINGEIVGGTLALVFSIIFLSGFFLH